MANLQVSYTDLSVAHTALTSTLLDGEAWKSASLTMTGNHYVDVVVHIKVQTNTSAGGETGTVDVYCSGSIDGTDFDGDLTPGDAEWAGGTITLAERLRNLKKLGTIRTPADDLTAYDFQATFNVASKFDGVLPPYICLVIVNNTGEALAAAANNVVDAYGVKYAMV